MSLVETLLLFLSGVGTGTIGGMLGLGGGVFLIPFLVIVLGLPMHQAIATSFLAVIATSCAGAVLNLERGMVNVRLGMLLETTTVTGAILGGITATYLSGATLKEIFSALMLTVAAIMIWRTRQKVTGRVAGNGVLGATFNDEADGGKISYSVRRVPLIMAISLLAGNISGLLGVGGGIFKVPAMNLLGGVPIKAATATSNFTIGVTAAASAFIYFVNGYMNPVVIAPTALGVLGGSMLGIRISRKVKGGALTLFFAVFLIVVAVELYFK
jgi:hypothetical protein